MSSVIHYYHPFNNCTACAGAECHAVESDGYMINPNTGEYIGRAVTLVHDWSGRETVICRDAARVNGALCANDNKYHTSYIYNSTDGEYYSESYANSCESDMHQCEHCGEWFDDWALEYDYCEGWLCSDCYSEHSNPIQSYHHNHGRFFKIGDAADNKTIGFELETDGYSDIYGAAREISDEYGDAVVLEEDCSLDEGFEIISQPHTVDALQDFDFEGLTDSIITYGADEAPTTAGLHLHFAREWFGAYDDYERDETIARVIVNYRNNWEMLVALSLRESDYQIEDYAAFPRGGDTVEDVLYYNGRSRYYAVNLQNSRTIEFRLGAGVANARYIRKWINLHIEMIEAARAGFNFTVNSDYTITLHDVVDEIAIA